MAEILYERPKLYKKQEAALFHPKRWGLIEASAQPLDLQIPTPWGWRRFGDLQVGDLVFSIDGSPTEVTNIIPHGQREVFKLTFTGNAVTYACDDHLWEVEHEQGRGRRVLKTSDLRGFTERTRLMWKFPTCAPVDYWIQTRPIHPWLLGVLIGDGCICSNVLSISSADEDLIDRVESVLPKGYELKRNTAEYSHTIKAKVRGAGYERPSIRFKAGAYEVYVARKYIGRRPTEADALALHKQAMLAQYGDDVPELNLRQALRSLGLLGLKHNEKFVPDCYKYNDVDTRIEILRGLLDTDGSLNHNSAIIEQTSPRLAADIEELVMSLGGFAKTTYTPARQAGWKASYRTNIHHPDIQSLFWLQRKKDKYIPGNPHDRRLIGIEPAGMMEVQCISVAHESELYLTSDFIVTHNTKAGKTVGCIAWIIEQAAYAAPFTNFVWVAPVSSQAAIAFTRLKQGLQPGTFTSKETPTPRIDLVNQTTIWCKSGDHADSIYGEDYGAAVIDEASRCKEDVWYAVRSTLTATSGPARIIGNVKGKKNWFYEWARRVERGEDPNARFARLTVLDAIAAGIIPASEVEDARRNLPEHVYNELYMAIPSADSGNPFGEDYIYACAGHPLAPGPVVSYGIDLAKKADYLVIVGLNQTGAVAAFHRWQGKSWKESIGLIHEIVGEDVPTLVDSTGLGDPVVEELQISHGNIRGFNFSNKSKQKIMEGLAVSIQRGETTFPDGPIKAELLNFEYKIMPSGAVTYQAAEGYNDDCVCALALAREKWSEGQPGANLIEFLNRQHELRVNPLELSLSAKPAANELTDLYLKTLRQFQEPLAGCKTCGLELGHTRVNDGEFSYHPQCYG